IHHVDWAVPLPGPAVRPPPDRLSQDRRSTLGDARRALVDDGRHPVGDRRVGAAPGFLVLAGARRWPGGGLPDRPGACLEHLGHGPPGAGGAGRGVALDQPRRPDPRHRLADPVRPGPGRPELTAGSGAVGDRPATAGAPEATMLPTPMTTRP